MWRNEYGLKRGSLAAAVAFAAVLALAAVVAGLTTTLALAAILALTVVGRLRGGIIEANGSADAGDGLLEGLLARGRKRSRGDAHIAAHQKTCKGGGGQKRFGLLALHDSILSIKSISCIEPPRGSDSILETTKFEAGVILNASASALGTGWLILPLRAIGSIHFQTTLCQAEIFQAHFLFVFLFVAF
jgi:hypothetical protein